MLFWFPIFAGDAITSPGCCTQLVMQGQDASCPYPSSPEKESPDVHMAAKISTKLQLWDIVETAHPAPYTWVILAVNSGA